MIGRARICTGSRSPRGCDDPGSSTEFHECGLGAGGVCSLCRYPLASAVRAAPGYRGAVRLALGRTAFYWLPAVVETGDVLGANGVPTPIQETFLDLWRYLNFSGPNNAGPVLTVLVPAVAVCVFFARQVYDAAGRWSSWPLVAGVLVYVFLTVRISEPLYSRVPFLASNLWVWRVLFPMILLAVILITPRLEALPSRLRTQRLFALAAVVAVLQAAAFILWNTASYLSVRSVDLDEMLPHLAYDGERTGASVSTNTFRIQGRSEALVTSAGRFAGLRQVARTKRRSRLRRTKLTSASDSDGIGTHAMRHRWRVRRFRCRRRET